MPKVKMMAGIASISGKFGNMYFRTDKKSGRVSLCNMPKTQCALTEKQKLHHARFANKNSIMPVSPPSPRS